MTARQEGAPNSGPTGTERAAVDSDRSRLVPLAVATALLMEFIDSTALATALPTLARAFETDPIHLKVALTSYLLALAVFAPASGWAADRFGARQVFTAAMAVFLTGSILCAMSRSLEALVAARIVQGMGGAMMTPVGRLIIVEMSPKAKLVTAMTWFTTPALVGPLIGPPLAGFLLEIGPWPWIFLINVPVGLAGIAAVTLLVPNIERPPPGRFDWRGFVLVAGGIILLIATAETIGLGLIPTWVQVAGGVAAAVALASYWGYARGRAHAVLDLQLLRYRTYRSSLVGGTLIRLGLGATPFLLPLLLQNALGWSPSQAGLIMIATAAGALAARFAVTRAIRRFGFKRILIGSGIGAAVLTAVPGLFDRGTPIIVMLVALAALGLTRSLQFIATNTIAFADVPDNKVSGASTLATVVQQIGMSLGITTGALLLAMATPATGSLEAGNFLLPFLVIGAISLLAAPIYFRLPPGAGSQVSGVDTLRMPHA